MHTKRKVNRALMDAREFWWDAPGNFIIRVSESQFPSRSFVPQNMKTRLAFSNLRFLNVGQSIVGLIGL